MLERWLEEAGIQVTARLPRGEVNLALVIANVREPKDRRRVRRLAAGVWCAHPGSLSAFRRGLAGSEEAARRLGVKKVLPKPFARKELLLAVRDAIEGALDD